MNSPFCARAANVTRRQMVGPRCKAGSRAPRALPKKCGSTLTLFQVPHTLGASDPLLTSTSGQMPSCAHPRRARGPAGHPLRVGQGHNLPHVTQGLGHGVAGAGTRLQADGVVCALRLSVSSCTAGARQGSQSERMPGGGSARAILDAQMPSLPSPVGLTPHALSRRPLTVGSRSRHPRPQRHRLGGPPRRVRPPPETPCPRGASARVRPSLRDALPSCVFLPAAPSPTTLPSCLYCAPSCSQFCLFVTQHPSITPNVLGEYSFEYYFDAEVIMLSPMRSHFLGIPFYFRGTFSRKNLNRLDSRR